jgi:hypothetical protein
MNLLLAGLTAAVVAGAVVAVSTREARASLLGLLVALLAAGSIADPLPAPLPFAARIAAALLAARLIAIAIRGLDRPTAGSRLGWPVEALAAVAAGLVGYATHGLGAPAMGPALASAAGFAVGIVAAAPLVTSRDVYRLGVGAMLLLSGGLLVRAGLGGTPSDLEQLVTCGLIVGVGGAIAVVVRGAREATGGDLSVTDDRGATRPAPSRHLGRTSEGFGRSAGTGPAAHPAGQAARSGAAPDPSAGR